MKLIFAVDAIFPPLTGIGRYAWELACGLDQSGCGDEVLCFSHGRFVPNPATAARMGSGSLAKGQDAAVSGWLRARLARIGPVVSLYAAVTPQMYRWRLRKLTDHLFHAPNYFLPPFAGPSIATVHDLSTLLYPEFHPRARVALMNKELPNTLKRATHLITDSEFIRQQVVEQLGWPADKVSAVALGVDARFHVRSAQETLAVLSAYGLGHDGYVLCVATIEPRKNIDRLIDAYQALPSALRSKYPLVLVGAPGWNSEGLHRRITGLQGHEVRYLNYAPQEHLYALYAGARLFAFPSIYEGFGLPVLEAFASGCPAVISSSSCLPELGGTAALQVDPMDTDAICLGLQRGIEDNAWRASATQEGLRIAGALTWGRCFEQTHQLYHQIYS